ncbi:hypothetical protein AOLI_G00318420 [Acnodon oligacanthus]
MVLLLLSYFNEKEDVMFSYVEDTCLAGEVQMDQVQLTPTIVVCGRFMLSVNRSIVQDNIPSFISALCMMFGSYYCFNIHYPSELASTLEFLQRYLECDLTVLMQKVWQKWWSRPCLAYLGSRLSCIMDQVLEAEYFPVCFRAGFHMDG